MSIIIKERRHRLIYLHMLVELLPRPRVSIHPNFLRQTTLLPRPNSHLALFATAKQIARTLTPSEASLFMFNYSTWTYHFLNLSWPKKSANPVAHHAGVQMLYSRLS